MSIDEGYIKFESDWIPGPAADSNLTALLDRWRRPLYEAGLIGHYDELGIGYLGKPKIPWSEVTGLDAAELQDKQILHLLHNQGQKLTLDGYKLKNFKELVAFVESRVPGGGEQTAPTEPLAEDASEDS